MYRRNKQARLLTGGLIGALPVTTPGDEHWDDVTLLLDGSSLTDASTAGNDFSAVGDAAANDTAVADPYGGSKGSFVFDGVGDALTSTNGDIIGIANPFTVEMWVRPDSTSTYSYIDIHGANSGWVSGGRLFELNASTTSLQLQWWDGVSNRYNLLVTNTMSAGTWHHLAVVYDGTGMEVYVDGSSIGSLAGTTTDGSATSTDFGLYHTGVLPFQGRMHDIRITKGVARYTGPFDPPKASLPTNAPVVGRRGVGSFPTALAVDTFATLDPTTVPSGTTLSNGNLTADFGATNGFAISTQTMSSGKYYFEVRCDVSSVYLGAMMVGVCDASGNQLSTFYGYDGTKRPPVASSYGTGISNGDVVGVALDADTGTTWFTDGSGNWQNGATAAGIADGSDTNYAHTSLNHPFTFGVSDASGGDIDIEVTCNFGQDATFNGTESAGTYTDANGLGEFQYEPPAGFVGLYTTTEVAPTVPTLRTRGYIGAAPAGGGMLTLYDRYVDTLT